MKMICDETLTFITPTFISGADQNVPEVRASSVRGAWRWWFRALGGSSDEEREVFGGVYEGTTASAVVVRVKMEPKYGDGIRFSPTSDKDYVYFFAAKSGNDKGVHRTEARHYLDAGSSFNLLVQLRRELPGELEQKLRKSLEAFLTLGALGLRAARGCGCFTAGSPITRGELVKRIGNLSEKIMVRVIDEKALYSTAMKCQEALGGFLRMLRKDNHLSGKNRSAFGFSDGKARESSALKLRPIEIKGGFLPVVIYTDVACGQPSCWEVVKGATKAIG